MNVKKILDMVSAEAALGVAIAGVPITAIFFGEARLKADDILANLEDDRFEVGIKEPLTWSHKIQGRKLVALASAYALTNKSYKEYREKAKELLSKKKFDEIEHAIDQDRVANYTVLDGDILATNCGDVLCVDAWSGQKFFSNAEAIREAVARCNNMMVGSVYLSLNTLYDEIGNLPPTKAGEDLGWNSLFDNPITVHFSSVLDKEKIPALVMHLDPDPRPMYQDC